MKNHFNFFVIILSFSMISCNISNKQVEQNIAMYSSVWDDIINKGDIDKINNTNFTEDITMVASPENVIGIDNFKAYYNQFLVGFSDIKFTIVDVFGQGDKLVKHWRFEGNHTGDFMGIPPTGKSVNVEGTTLVQMREGKIAQEQDFMDNALFMLQLGLVPNPENTAIIDQLYANFGKGEVPAVLEMMSPNIVWNESSCSSYSDNNPYTSPEAVLNGVFGRIGQDNEYFKLENIKLAGLGDNKVLASLNYDFKSKNTGKVHKTTVVHEWTLENGKVTAFQQYLGLGEQ